MKTSNTYASKLVQAHHGALLGMRAVTLTDVAGTKPADSRQAFRAVNKRQSSSGQTPTFHQFFFANKQRRMHAAYLLLKYYAYRMSPEIAADPNPHGLAFLSAFDDYRLRLGIFDVKKINDSETAITGERMNLLIGKGYDRNWREIPKGGVTCFENDNGKIMACRRCEVPHFVEAHYVNYICTECE